MKSRILILSFLAACYPCRAQAAETNLTIETTSRGDRPLVVARGEGTNLIFEINPRGIVAYSPSNPVRDIDLVGIGPWSGPVSDGHGNRLRGRLLVYWGTKTTNGNQVYSDDAPTYVEIQDMTAANQHPTRIYFDKEHLPFVLRDVKGVPANALSPIRSSGGSAPSLWATLPASGRVRYRADASKGGLQRNDGELRLGFSMGRVIPPGDTHIWSLSATLLPPPPPNDSTPYSSNVWQGTLELPAVRISVLKSDLR